MGVLPGVAGSTNAQQKTVGLATSAVTALNTNSAYTPSATGPGVFGSVSLPKLGTATNGTWTSPSISGGVMSFGGNQAIAYSDNSDLLRTTITSSQAYSVQVDLKTTTIAPVAQFVLNYGEGYGIGWSEWNFQINGNLLRLGTNSTQDADGQAWYDFARIRADEWYRAGFMFYMVGSQNYIRLYLNGVQIFQRAIGAAYTSALPSNSTARTTTAYTSSIGGVAIKQAADRMPANSSNGVSLGNDYANYPQRAFYGSLRNVFVGKTNFWTI